MFANTNDQGTTFKSFFNIFGTKKTNNTHDTRYQVILQKMADIAKEYLPKSSNKNSLTCQYARADDQIDLINHFNTVADSLRNHKPTLIKSQ